jgi:predicted DsbA family dithiol-disulfide isomerase
LARAEGGAALQERLVDALFAGYFTDGQNIGDQAVLERIADKAGMRPGALQRSLPGQTEVRKSDDTIRAMGLSGVPSYLVGGKLLFSGSQNVEGYVQRLASASLVS